jgi:hypothetical protein
MFEKSLGEHDNLEYQLFPNRLHYIRRFKNHDFKRCVFNKSYSFLCNKEHGCIIYMMYDQGVIKEYKILKHNFKLGVNMQNLG